MDAKRSAKLKRVQIDNITTRLVTTLKESAGVTKTNEVINNGISILWWAVKAVKEGKKIAAYDPTDGEVELFTMPILDRVAHNEGERIGK